MKHTLTAILVGIGLSVFAETPTITEVTARQRYPWNGKVDIAFTVSGSFNQPVFLKVSAVDQTSGTTYTADKSALSGETDSTAGTHHVVWDLNAQGLAFKSDDVIFTVFYAIARYCVIDLSSGENAARYPVAYMDTPPSGGFNTDEYKTTKLVLRLLEPGPIPTLDATITKRFYVGLFEVTQKQYSLVMGGNPSYFSGETRPVERVSYDMIRGSANGAQWPASNDVDYNSFLGKFRTRTGLCFDLPTEAQWEYACRAGTTTTFSYGDSADGSYMWYSNNSSRQTHNVGTKLPNAWGLYDMHGNVWEWCLDWRSQYRITGNDPVGPSSGSYRVERGGSYVYDASTCASSYRYNLVYPSDKDAGLGFRLVRTLSN